MPRGNGAFELYQAEKEKKGKKRMKSVGSVNIPQEAFMAVFDQGE